jgi:hypothetical protein
VAVLNQEILRATGGPTVNEGQLKWFQNHGAAGFTTFNDAERKFLQVASAEPVGTTLSVAEMWRKLLVAGAYMGAAGTLNDGMLAYWTAQ